MSQDREQIRNDMPSRARDAISERVETIKGAIGNAADSFPSPSEGLGALRSAAAKNPLGLAIGSIAIGFIVGLCLPVTDIERERVGRIGERMTEQAKNAASDAIQQGKAAVSQAIGDALSSATQPPAA